MTILTQALRHAQLAAHDLAQDIESDMPYLTPALAWLFWSERSDAAILRGLPSLEQQRVRDYFEAMFSAEVAVSK